MNSEDKQGGDSAALVRDLIAAKALRDIAPRSATEASKP